MVTTEAKKLTPSVAPQPEAVAAAKPAPPRKRLQPMSAVKQAEAAAAAGTGALTGPSASSAVVAAASATAAARRAAETAVGPASSALSAATQAAVSSLAAAAPAQTAPVETMVTGRRGGYGGVRGFRRRSEIDRQLDALIGPSGRLKEASRLNIIKVLRMFNLCDIAPSRTGPSRPLPLPPQIPTTCEDRAGYFIGSAATNSAAGGGPASTGAPAGTDTQGAAGSGVGGGVKDEVMSEAGGQTGPVGPDQAQGPKQEPMPGVPGLGSGLNPGQQGPAAWALQGPSGPPPGVVTARQRARMADMSLLLDVILKTSSATVKKDFVACGVLNQLHQVCVCVCVREGRDGLSRTGMMECALVQWVVVVYLHLQH